MLLLEGRPMGMMKGHKIRDRLRKRDGDFCQACHQLMRFGVGVGPPATIDHVIPRVHGGSSKYSNLQLLCHACNGAKGNKLEGQETSKFWRLRCGLCGRLEPCLEHGGQGGRRWT